MGTMADKFLTGKFLVSMPEMDDERFAESVVYICSHGKEGSMGFVINKKLKDFSFSDLAIQIPVHTPANLESLFLYQGGPLERIRGFVLHSAEYNKPGTFQIDDKVAVSSSLDILTDIAYGNGPRNNLIALGYSGWEPMQLETELINNKWLVVPANADLLFNTPDELKWQRAMDESGVDLTRFIASTGHA